MWANAFTGLPFILDGRDRSGLDCWGLVRLVYKDQLNIDLPSFSGAFKDLKRETLQKISNMMAVESRNWNKVDAPQEYDVVLLRAYGSLASHVGICLGNGLMLHVLEDIDSVIEPINGPRWRNRVAGYYRYV
ncbi:MAG: C40 family peptidase [Magnetococcales bacterium]|nr:C40 family peptidase [Magnetococcales bacterium]